MIPRFLVPRFSFLDSSRAICASAAGLLFLTAAAVLIHGYHFGVEDQTIYLPAIKKILDPSLYPRDAEFFLAQTKPTVFPQIVAATVRISHSSIENAVLGWQVFSILLILAASRRWSRKLFAAPAAQCAAVAMVVAVLTLPVSGTALYLVDPYLHLRAPAMALLLFMLADVMERKLWRALLLAAMAATIHIQMTFYALLLAVFLLLPERWLGWLGGTKERENRLARTTALAALPLQSLFEPGTPAWQEAARTRWQHYLLRWPWYAWIGIFAPLILLFWFGRIGLRHGRQTIADLCRRLVGFGIFVFVISAVMTIPPRLERLTPYQPMRGFHLIYFFLVLLAGGWLGEFLLQSKVWRWLLLFLPLSFTMFYVQRQIFPASPHIEWPGAAPRNPWLEAFAWVRQNTPRDAYFALDPYYAARPGEDVHGFRAFAERSMMADYVKDSAVSLLFPSVAGRWQREVHARDGWQKFSPADFERLDRDFGVDWVVVEQSHPSSHALACPYQNELLRVCRITQRSNRERQTAASDSR